MDKERYDAFVEKVRESNHPFSEKFRMVAEKWVDADSAANLLEDTNSSVLSEMKLNEIRKEPGLADNAAERTVKASEAWKAHVNAKCEARRNANRLKVFMDYLRMRHSEQQSLEATQRAEMKL
jgi:DNA primase